MEKTLRIKIPHVLFFALVSSLALAVSFPPFNFFPTAYIFLVPLLYCVRRYKIGFSASLATAFLTGVVGYGVILYWIFPTVIEHTGSVLQAAISLFLISAYPSLYLVVFVAAAGFLWRNGNSSESIFPTVVVLPALWVALEYIRSLVFTGFPWAIAGYSQWNFRTALWVASYGGVFSVSFMIIVGNILFFEGIKKFANKVALSFFAVWLVVGVIISVGNSTKQPAFGAAETQENFVPITVIQPSIDQTKKWDKQYYDEIKEKISDLVVATTIDKNEKDDIILWPETSLTEEISDSSDIPCWIRNIVKKSGRRHIVGTLLKDKSRDEIYNVAVVISNDGRAIEGVHKKTHLVPFGEFVPLRKILEPFFGIFNVIGDFKKADTHTVIEIDGKKISVVICSENLYGDITRRFVKNGAEVLLVITNDAWYGRTPAAFQHFTFNVLRAVENSRWIVQSANTGVSGVVSDDGRIIKATNLFESVWFSQRTPLRKNLTFYARCGDLFAIICLVFSVGVIGFLAVRKRETNNRTV